MVKLVIISDTHCNHDKLTIPHGDILIHCGDYSNCGSFHETKQFFDWFSKQPHKYKIVIPGNHEVGICPLKLLKNEINPVEYRNTHTLIKSYNNVNFLIDDYVFIDGIKFYGSPWCGGKYNVMNRWGFYIPIDMKISDMWKRIPDDSDIVITHTPPYGILDDSLGCPFLTERIKKINPMYHFFGHIHNLYGGYISDYTEYYNCSSFDGIKINPPIVLDI